MASQNDSARAEPQPPPPPQSPPPAPPPVHNPYTSPTAMGDASPRPADVDATGGLIPYKNPAALVSYYLGIVSLLPVLGFPFGVAAIILARKGFKKRRETPAVRGKVHAWIGMILGLLGMPLHFLFGSAIVVGIVQAITG